MSPTSSDPSPHPITVGTPRPPRADSEASRRLHDRSSQRYLIGERLGAGGTAEVYAVTDVDLRRDAAMKILHADAASDDGSVAMFLEEARVTAALEHPNVLPVHDLDCNSDGRLYFIMKRVEGISLAEAISASTPTKRHPLIAGANDVVTLFLAIGQALAFAHARHVRHHDIKPANIMLGRFGEAMLADWGSATCSVEPRIASHGTPLYASPEQLRGEPVDGRSDQYGFGASLFEALLLRPPLPQDGINMDELVWRKCQGKILLPDADEQRRVSAPLLAIALKALAARPEARYADITALVDDLRAFQAGLSVAAYPEPLLRRAAQWARRNARTIAVTMAVASLIIALSVALIGERLKERATWGSPVIEERFDPSWTSRWSVVEGGFERDASGIHSTKPRRNIIAFTQRCDGDTAIEVRARVAADAPLGDLAIGWGRSPIRSGSDVTYRCAMGEWDGFTCAIKCDDRYVARYEELRQSREHDYRIRVEVIGDRLTLSVDGHRLCSYVGQFPLIGGYLALFAYDPGKVFESMEVYSLGIPEKLAATALGDVFVASAAYPRAIEEYVRVAVAHPHSKIGESAWLRSGLCHLRLGEAEEARRDFAEIGEREMALRAELELAHRGNPQEDGAFATACEHALASGDSESIDRAVQYWCERVAQRIDHADVPTLRRYLDLQRRLFPMNALARSQAAEVELALGHYDEIIARYPDQARFVAEALICLGRGEESLQRSGGRPILERMAMVRMGRWGELRDRSGIWGVVEEGRAEDALAHGAERTPGLLMATGRFSEAARAAKDPDTLCRIALLAGSADALHDDHSLKISTRLIVDMAHRLLPEALALAADAPTLREWPRLLAGVRAARAGKVAEADACFTTPDTLAYDQRHFTFAHFVIAPFTQGIANHDPRALMQACARAMAQGQYIDQQRPWHRAAYLLRRIDRTAFIAQPYRQFAKAELLLLDALRDDLSGSAATANTGYRDYLALPRYQRESDIDPVLEEFVEWRLSTTKAEDATIPQSPRR